MNNKLKLTLGTLPVLLSMAVMSAHAGSLGKVANDTLEFTLTEPLLATMQVTPENNLQSGSVPDATKLATAVASLGANPKSATDLGVKWVNTDQGGMTNPNNPEKYSLVSTSDKSKLLKVKLTTDSSGSTNATKKTSDTTLVGTQAGAEITDMTLYVVVDGPTQTVIPGTYSGVLQAAAYTK